MLKERDHLMDVTGYVEIDLVRIGCRKKGPRPGPQFVGSGRLGEDGWTV